MARDNDNDDDDESGEQGGAGRRKWLPVALAALAFVAIVAGLYVFFQSIQGLEPAPPPRIQEISVVQPPPPPPPPPPPEEPPPPPEPEIREPEPEPEPEEKAPEPEAEEAPPAPDLGVDAEGGVGSDGFGLVGRKGGRGLIGGTGTGTLAGWYTGILQRELQAFLEGQSELRRKQYSVVVRLWLAEDGRVKRSQLDSSSGDPKVDAAIEQALNSGFQVSERPPESKFQAVKIRLTSRT